MKTKEQFLNDKLTAERSSSPAGHHFIQLYNTNKWNFYLKHVLGLEPVKTKPPLIFGGAIHDAKESLYLYEDPDFAIELFHTILENRKPEYEDSTQYEKDYERGGKMLMTWCNTYLQTDLETMEIIEVEGSHTFDLANGMHTTVRWDLLARQKSTGSVYLFDTKTTGWSIPGTYTSVQNDDQSTMYLLALKKVYPELYRRSVGLIPDIMYQRQNVVKAERPGIVLRTERELIEYEQELIGLFVEMSQKVQHLQQNPDWPPHMLFPRNGKDESMFKGSEYHDIYRSPLPKDKPPVGFRYNPNLIAEIETGKGDYK